VQSTPPAKRGRGRPRIVRNDSSDTGEQAKAPKPTRVSKRLPHNQVERKYREGLNAEMEKLRATIPALPQGNQLGATKPSKATVLQHAVDEIERGRDVIAKLENDNLRLRSEFESEMDRAEKERARLETERDRWRLEAEALRIVGKL